MLKLFKSKRGQKEFWGADTPPFYLIFGIIFNAVFILFLISVNSNAAAKAKISENLEEFTIISGFLYSDKCFLYSNNDITRAYKFDFNKFTEENLNNCVQSRKATKLILKLDNQEKIIKSKNWDNRNPPKVREPINNILVYKDNNFVKADLIAEFQ